MDHDKITCCENLQQTWGNGMKKVNDVKFVKSLELSTEASCPLLPLLGHC